MSFDVRLAVTCGIFFIGMQVAYFGMKFNGSAHPRNPAWQIVNGLHSLITYGPLYALAVVILVVVIIPFVLSLIENIPDKKKPDEWMPRVEYPKNKITSEEALAIKRQRERKREDEREARKIYEEKLLEAEIKKQEIEELEEKKRIERRRNLTAEDVAKSALDDFL